MARDTIRRVSLFLPAGVATPPSEWRPLADLYRTRDGWLVKFDLAGVRPEDVELFLVGRTLVVRGSRRDCCVEEGASHYRMEIAYSHFERRVELPAETAGYSLETQFRDGMLLVRVRPDDAGE
jgi:HSP20 family protein